MAFSTKIIGDSSKNCRVHVAGFIIKDITDEDPAVILDLDKLKDCPQNLRLDSLWWLIEEKMGLRLWWKPGCLLLPLESRNNLRFDTPLSSKDFAPPGWCRKLYLSSHDAGSGTTKLKYFNIGLDMEKS